MFPSKHVAESSVDAVDPAFTLRLTGGIANGNEWVGPERGVRDATPLPVLTCVLASPLSHLVEQGSLDQYACDGSTC